MAKFTIEIPKIYSVFALVFGILFGFFWLEKAFKTGDTAFILLGILFFTAFVGSAIYMLIKGRHPFTVRQIK